MQHGSLVWVMVAHIYHVSFMIYAGGVKIETSNGDGSFYLPIDAHFILIVFYA